MKYHLPRRFARIAVPVVAVALLLGACSSTPASSSHKDGGSTSAPGKSGGVQPVAAVIAHGLSGLLLPTASVPKELVPDAAYDNSSGEDYDAQAEHGAKSLGCSAGAGEAFVDPGFVDGDGSKEAASKHQVLLSYVLNCPHPGPGSVLAAYQKDATNSDLKVTPVGGLGQGAITEEVGTSTTPTPVSGSYVWYEGSYLLSLTYSGTLPSFSMPWLSLQAFNLQQRDFDRP
jgi:hypothetical protein